MLGLVVHMIGTLRTCEHFTRVSLEILTLGYNNSNPSIPILKFKMTVFVIWKYP